MNPLSSTRWTPRLWFFKTALLPAGLLFATGCGAADSPTEADKTLPVTKEAPTESTPANVNTPSESKPKDPLAYRVHSTAAGSIALFEDWKITPVPSNDAQVFETHPDGKENDFQLLVVMATPSSKDMANLYQDGPAFVRRMLPAAQRTGEPEDLVFGGDPARRENYSADFQGKSYQLQLIMVKKKDVAVVVLGIGLPEGFATYGRAVEIMAQSVTIKETPTDPALTGTWTKNESYVSGTFSFATQKSITFYSNGTFSESTFAGGGGETSSGGNTSGVSQGGSRGRIVRRGNSLTFQYDNGNTQTRDYRIIDGRALKMGNETYFKQ